MCDSSESEINMIINDKYDIDKSKSKVKSKKLSAPIRRSGRTSNANVKSKNAPRQNLMNENNNV